MFQGRNLVSIAFVALGLGACGGSEPPPKGIVPLGQHEKALGNDATSAHPDPEVEQAAAALGRATCDDGGCSPCGDAVCLNGWYCDETAPGGPSCGWLPECAQKSGCACVKKALGCACEDKGGAAHISCK